MRVLMLAIRYDTADWATNFIPKWAAALAGHVTALDVLALEVGDVGTIPANVRVFSMGKAPGVSRLAVLAGFYRHAAQLIPQCDAVFVHMIPRYALLAAPLVLPLRKPMTLWYTHRNPSPDLKRALPLVRHVVTAVPSSFPLTTDKLHVLGHGIDADFFGQQPTTRNEINERVVVQVARVQPIKNQDALLRNLPPNAHAVIVGDVPDGEDRTYIERLHTLADECVTFTGGLPPDAVRDWYYRAAVAVNLSPPGLFDKAALESMAAGTPTLVSNSAFDDLLGAWREQLRVNYPLDDDEIAAKLRALLALSPDERAAIGRTLRQNVRAAHSLNALIPRLIHVLRS